MVTEWRTADVGVEASGDGTPPLQPPGRIRQIVWFMGAAAVTVLLLALLWYAGRVLLLALGGIILAVFLTGLSRTLAKYSRLPYQWSLALVITALLALFGLACWLMASGVARQMDELTVEIPRAVDRLAKDLEQYRWFQFVLARFRNSGNQMSSQFTLSSAGNVFSAAADAGVQALLVVLIGFYGAISPNLYLNGMVRLFPIPRRPLIRQTLEAASDTLWWWVICRIVSMLWVGVSSILALWLLGIPLPLSLGIIAGLCRFVPYIGPWLGAVPALLLALIVGPESALYVAAIYVAIEIIDDYFVLPLLQWRSMWLPPALAIFAQVLLGTLWGVIGVLFAMPLAAVVMVFVQILYVQDVLGDPVQVIGQSKHESQPNTSASPPPDRNAQPA